MADLIDGRAKMAMPPHPKEKQTRVAGTVRAVECAPGSAPSVLPSEEPSEEKNPEGREALARTLRSSGGMPSVRPRRFVSTPKSPERPCRAAICR